MREDFWSFPAQKSESRFSEFAEIRTKWGIFCKSDISLLFPDFLCNFSLLPGSCGGFIAAWPDPRHANGSCEHHHFRFIFIWLTVLGSLRRIVNLNPIRTPKKSDDLI